MTVEIESTPPGCNQRITLDYEDAAPPDSICEVRVFTLIPTDGERPVYRYASTRHAAYLGEQG